MHNLIGIDCDNLKSAKFYAKRLAKLKSTIEIVSEPAQYNFYGEQKEATFIIRTTKTENEIGDWLYNQKIHWCGIGYIGTYQKGEASQ